MNTRQLQKLLMPIILLVVALALHFFLVEFRIQEQIGIPETPDVYVPGKGMIIYLGETTLPPEPGTDLARFHGKTVAERGLYSRQDIPPYVAGFFGLVVPVFLVIFSMRRALKNG